MRVKSEQEKKTQRVGTVRSEGGGGDPRKVTK